VILFSLWLQDTFRGRVCQCPLVQGVQFEGDGYTHCEGIMTFPRIQQPLIVQTKARKSTSEANGILVLVLSFSSRQEF